MFRIALRGLPSTIRLIGGPAVRSLTCGPAHSTASLPSINFIPRYNPVLIDPSFISHNNRNILDTPIINKTIIDVPNKIIPFEDKSQPTMVEEPGNYIKKEAARLIVIRRRKMKRHKLKKLRIKMKFIWAKVRQRREIRKEKAFQAELMCKVKEAEKFDAKEYVRVKLDEANATFMPNVWKGKHLPQFLIKDLIEKKNKREAQRFQDLERRKKINLNASDYKF